MRRLLFLWAFIALAVLACSNAFAQPSARITFLDAGFHGGGVSGALVEDFDPDVLAYTVAASAEHTSFGFFLTLEDPTATVSLNGTPLTVNDGSVFGDLPISVPYVGTFAVESGAESRSYVINAVATSPNAKLASLTANQGAFNTPFDPDGTSAQILLAKEQVDVRLTATPQEPDATMTLDGAPITAGVPTEAIAVPAWPAARGVVFRVTAPNGRNTREYSVTLTRLPGTDARLAAIELTPETPLSPTFSPDVDSYDVALPFVAETLQLRPTAVDPDAQIRFNVGFDPYEPVASGAQTPPIPVPVGSTFIQLQVNSESGAQIRGYTLRVTRALDPSVAVQTFGSSLQCCPMNAEPNQTEFFVTAQPHQRSASIIVTTVDPNATMVFNGAPLGQGVLSAPVDLSTPAGFDNPKVVPLIVTSADGQISQRHDVKFIRQASTENRLSALVIEGAELVPAFNPNGIFYNVNVPPGGAIQLRANAMDAGATLETLGLRQGPLVSGELSAPIVVPDGDSTLVVKVTAEDTRWTREYYLNIRTQVPDINTLRLLYLVDGVLEPEFAPEISQYTFRMASVFTETFAVAEATDPQASITVNGQPLSAQPAISALGENPRAVIAVTAQNGAVREYVIHIQRENAPPTLTAAASIELLEDGTGTLAIAVGDIETAAGELTLSAVSSDPSLITDAALAAGMTGTGVERILMLRPVADAFGEATVTLTVSDGAGATARQAVLVRVLPVNDRPSFFLRVLEYRMPTSTAVVTVPQVLAPGAPGPANESAQRLITATVTASPLRGDARILSAEVSLQTQSLVFQTNGRTGMVALDIAVQDDGGTVNGGTDTSATQRLIVQVSSQSNAVDLSVLIEPGPIDGTRRSYRYLAYNLGPGDGGQLQLSLPDPVGLINLSYACTTDVYGTCSLVPPEQGRRALLTLRNRSIAEIVVSGELRPGADFVELQGALTAAVGVPVDNPGDDTATYTEAVSPEAIWRDGFER